MGVRRFSDIDYPDFRTADRPKLLLHVCCAPCAAGCIERLTERFDVTMFFYNPNITDETEYGKRFGELVRFAS